MAIQYKIYFSTSEDIIKLSDGEYTVRDLEIIMLQQLYTIAIDSQKRMSNVLLCKDCIKQLEEIGKGKYIELTEQDIEFAKGAFELTAYAPGLPKNHPRRQQWWAMECETMLRQLNKPKEV
jgi:hypothetical protein